MLSELATQLVSSCQNLDREQNQFDVQNNFQQINQLLSFKKPDDDDRYQFIPLDRHLAQFIDFRLFYEDDLKKGGELMAATETYEGKDNELDLIEGEVLCTLGVGGDDVKICKNINESKGRVSLSKRKHY
jgi:hypothetical protein